MPEETCATEPDVELLPVETGDELVIPDDPEPADPLPIDDEPVEPIDVLPVVDWAFVEVANARSTRATRIGDLWSNFIL